MIIPKNLEMKECYHNMLKVYYANLKEFANGTYKLCIGAIQNANTPHILIKHAYIIDKDNKIAYDYLTDVDPNKNLKYFNIKVISNELDIKKYINFFTYEESLNFWSNLSEFIKEEEELFLKQHRLLDMFIGQEYYFITDESSNLLNK